MSLLASLAARDGARPQDVTGRAAKRCLADPALLDEVAGALGTKDARLAGNCAEVLTKVAERRPDLVSPRADLLLSLLGHRNGRVRWEAAHALALVSSRAPKTVEKALPRLEGIARDDGSVIVRDYCLDAIAAYGATGPKAAARVLPILIHSLDAFGSKHAARVLDGLQGLAAADPNLADDVHECALRFSDYPRPAIRRAARALLRALEGPGR